MCLLFAGACYYAKGGFNDFQGAYFDTETAMKIVKANAEGPRHGVWEWWHIINQETLDVLAHSEWQAHGCDEDSYVSGPG